LLSILKFAASWDHWSIQQYFENDHPLKQSIWRLLACCKTVQDEIEPEFIEAILDQGREVVAKYIELADSRADPAPKAFWGFFERVGYGDGGGSVATHQVQYHAMLASTGHASFVTKNVDAMVTTFGIARKRLFADMLVTAIFVRRRDDIRLLLSQKSSTIDHKVGIFTSSNARHWP
jgi:hypothetical protein